MVDYPYAKLAGESVYRTIKFSTTVPSARNVLLQPFLATSIWNTPLGAGVNLVDAGLSATSLSNGRVSTDPILTAMDTTAPVRNISSASYYRKASDGTVINVTGNYQIPAGSQVFLPDSLTWDGKNNGITAILKYDATGRVQYYYEGQPLIHDPNEANYAPNKVSNWPNASWPYTKPTPYGDLYGDGIPGKHGGSALSALGGMIRAWEWNGTAPIMHVLSLEVFGERFLSTTTNGYRWPATNADGGYNQGPPTGNSNFYGRTGTGYDDMKMGTLLCLPQTYDETALTTAFWKRAAWTLKNFGAYLTDNTKRDVHAFSVESTIDSQWSAMGTAWHAEGQAVIAALKAVTNNTSTNIGGPGARLTTPVSEVTPPP